MSIFEPNKIVQIEVGTGGFSQLAGGGYSYTPPTIPSTPAGGYIPSASPSAVNIPLASGNTVSYDPRTVANTITSTLSANPTAVVSDIMIPASVFNPAGEAVSTPEFAVDQQGMVRFSELVKADTSVAPTIANLTGVNPAAMLSRQQAPTPSSRTPAAQAADQKEPMTYGPSGYIPTSQARALPDVARDRINAALEPVRQAGLRLADRVAGRTTAAAEPTPTTAPLAGRNIQPALSIYDEDSFQRDMAQKEIQKQFPGARIEFAPDVGPTTMDARVIEAKQSEAERLIPSSDRVASVRLGDATAQVAARTVPAELTPKMDTLAGERSNRLADQIRAIYPSEAASPITPTGTVPLTSTGPTITATSPKEQGQVGSDYAVVSATEPDARLTAITPSLTEGMVEPAQEPARLTPQALVPPVPKAVEAPRVTKDPVTSAREFNQGLAQRFADAGLVLSGDLQNIQSMLANERLTAQIGVDGKPDTKRIAELTDLSRQLNQYDANQRILYGDELSRMQTELTTLRQQLGDDVLPQQSKDIVEADIKRAEQQIKAFQSDPNRSQQSVNTARQTIADVANYRERYQNRIVEEGFFSNRKFDGTSDPNTANIMMAISGGISLLGVAAGVYQQEKQMKLQMKAAEDERDFRLKMLQMQIDAQMAMARGGRGGGGGGGGGRSGGSKIGPDESVRL